MSPGNVTEFGFHEVLPGIVVPCAMRGRDNARAAGTTKSESSVIVKPTIVRASGTPSRKEKPFSGNQTNSVLAAATDAPNGEQTLAAAQPKLSCRRRSTNSIGSV